MILLVEITCNIAGNTADTTAGRHLKRDAYDETRLSHPLEVVLSKLVGKQSRKGPSHTVTSRIDRPLLVTCSRLNFPIKTEPSIDWC